jgi:hypothetical protein
MVVFIDGKANKREYRKSSPSATLDKNVYGIVSINRIFKINNT